MNGILSQRTTPQSIWAAGLIATVILLATIVIVPISDRPLEKIIPFLPMFAMAVFLIENLTAYFLVTHFHTTHEPFLAALAGSYGFVAIMAAIQVLIFPGVFSTTGLFGAGVQSSAWAWTLWHGGFPFFILLALLLRLPSLQRWPKIVYRAGWLLMMGAPLSAITLAYLLIVKSELLPPLIRGGSYLSLTHSYTGLIMLAINLMALFACLRITRLRDLLSLWLTIALIASLADLIITLSATARFSLGWYAGRILSVVSSSMVLGVLIWEISHLYRQLTHTNVALAERVIRDGLTGAFNRGHFIEQFPHEVQRANRDKKTLSLLMIDVDHFKAYNDTLGHQMGDQCLIAIIGAIQNVIRRPTDYVARYGGEEFVLVLPDTDVQQAMQVAHAVRNAVARLQLRRNDAHANVVTVSVGIATFDPLIEKYDTQELIRRADQALYQAKLGGRDTFRVYGAPEDDGGLFLLSDAPLPHSVKSTKNPNNQ